MNKDTTLKVGDTVWVVFSGRIIRATVDRITPQRIYCTGCLYGENHPHQKGFDKTPYKGSRVTDTEGVFSTWVLARDFLKDSMEESIHRKRLSLEALVGRYTELTNLVDPEEMEALKAHLQEKAS